MPVFTDKISTDKIAEQKIEIAALKAQIANPEIKKEKLEAEPVKTPVEDKQAPAPAKEPKPEPVSALDAKRAELQGQHNSLTIMYNSLEAGSKRSECRAALHTLACRLKALE
jgi:hypothetical protein